MLNDSHDRESVVDTSGLPFTSLLLDGGCLVKRRRNTRQEFWNDRNVGVSLPELGLQYSPVFADIRLLKEEKCLALRRNRVILFAYSVVTSSLRSHAMRTVLLQVGRVSVVHFSLKIALPMARGE
jgi:hypothetical protein